eukprot:CAMPEP_0181392960 /NCGR_PEP_ID=MMETSP1106-20121128/26891_1 /TAXON_ID=81844 /ORGANISM="Mantoniella antarctica, Strain SL-175" /LENGTH=103 /DNA_ID=CAMNT_0023514161 /DNA_START=104 /DNA_END=411 /DNA_ORIENTATION=-
MSPLPPARATSPGSTAWLCSAELTIFGRWKSAPALVYRCKATNDPIDQRETATSSADRQETATSPADQRRTVISPADQREVATASGQEVLPLFGGGGTCTPLR